MNYFFGYENKLSNSIDWFFNFNHLFLIIFVSLFVLMCTFLLNAKSEKGIKITKIVIASTLFILEIGRIIYKFLMHKHYGGSAQNFNWWWNISFQMCAIMCWTTIITLILSVFIKKQNRFLQMLYNILFGCAMIGGILTFIYPDCLDSSFPFFHFVNIQTILVHALLIFVPIYLIKIKHFKVEIKNIWNVFVGYVYIGCIAMTASIISGNNFAYSLKFDLVNLGLAFPWHLPILMLALTAFSALIYGAFELVYYLRLKNTNKICKNIDSINKLNFAIFIMSRVCAIVFGALIMLSTASLIGKTNTMLGLLCLIALVYMIMMLLFAEWYAQYIYSSLEMNNKAKHITLIVLLIIFALPVGIMYLSSYIKQTNTKN